MTAYDKVRTARSTSRPTAQDYITGMFDGFVELHGDRRYSDDEAIIGGLAYLKGKAVMGIAGRHLG